jgi:dTDP-4-dehydrorhamnose reductase
VIRLLQFGTSGQVARAMIAASEGRAQLTALSRADCNLEQPGAVARAFFNSPQPDIVVNAAAYTAVDKAEADAPLAFRVNCEAVREMAQACAARKIPLIHISTDYVFDGEKAGPYREDDAVNPLNVYGRSKLAGENALRETWDAHVILRTSWVYSPWGTNFVRTMLRLGVERDELRIVCDQVGGPTSALQIADTILTVATALRGTSPADRYGTFHLAVDGVTSWAGFAERIFAGVADWLPVKARVVPISASEYPSPTRRPGNSRLDCSKLRAHFGIAPGPWENALSAVLEEIKRGAT